MSKLVDERVVEMQFENKDFEKNVNTSIDSIDRLKSSLNFSGVTNSINKTFEHVDTSPITNALLKTSEGFSVMEIAAITAISNITNRVVDLGLQMVKSLSVDNITAGWAKYEEKTTSVATLMAQNLSKIDDAGNEIQLEDDAEKMEFINEQLSKLAFFSDETSYTFTDMVSNISKFTATGQNLQDSVEAIMGVANWAALSGQNAATASRAMYQLSQAMGQGVVKLMDWKSIQNANMDTDEFREKVLATAVAMGTLQQSIDGTYVTLTGKEFTKSQFTTQLSEGWFTSDILMKTLNEYSSAVDQVYEAVNNGDYSTASEAIAGMKDELDEFGLKAFRAAQEAKTLTDALNATKDAVASAWMNIFENIIGSYDKAKVLWTDFAMWLWDAFAAPVVKVNDILTSWGDLGGRDDLFANTEENTGAFWNLLNAITALSDVIKKAWNTIFPLSEMEEENDQINDIGKKLKNFTERLKEATAGLMLTEETSEKLSNILKGLFSILKLIKKAFDGLMIGIRPLVEVFKTLFSKVFGLMSDAGESFTDFVDNTTIFERIGTKMAEVLTLIIEKVKLLPEKLKPLMPYFEKIKMGISMVIKYLKQLPATLTNVYKSLSGKSIGVFLQKIGAVFMKAVDLLKSCFNEFKNIDTSGLDKFTEDTTKKMSPLRNLFEGFVNLLKGVWSIIKGLIPVITAVFNFIGKLFDEIGKGLENVFGGENSLKNLTDIISFIISSLFIKDLSGLINTVGSIVESFVSIFDGVSGYLDAQKMKTNAEALKTMGVAILLLVASLVLIASIDRDKLAESIVTLVEIMATLLVSMKIINKISEGAKVAIVKTAFAMMGFSIAILILAGALKTVASMSGKDIFKGLTALTVMIAELTLVAKLLSTSTKTIVKGMGGLVLMAIAIRLLVKPLKELGSLDIKQLTKGFAGLTALLGLCILYSKFGTNINKGVSSATSMLIFAIALRTLSKPMIDISKLSWEGIAKGIVGLIAIAGIMVGVGALSKYMKSSIISAAGLTQLAIAFVVMSIPMVKLSKLNWEEIAKGIVSLIAIAGIMVGVGVLSKYMKSSIISAIGLTMLAVAFNVMVVPFAALSKLNWEGIAKAVVSLLSIAGIMVGVSKLMTVGNSASLILFGIALIGISTGLLIFASAMAILASIPFLGILKGMGTIIVMFAALIVAGKLLKGVVPTLLGLSVSFALFAVAALALSVAISTLIAVLGTFANSLVYILVSVCQAIIAAGPEIAVAIGVLIQSICKGLLLAIDPLFEVVKTVIYDLCDLLISVYPKLIDTILTLIVQTLEAIRDKIGTIITLVSDIVVGLIKALNKEVPRIITALIELLSTVVKSILEALPTYIDLVVNALFDFIINVLDKLGNTIEYRAKEIGVAFVKFGKQLMKGLWNGMMAGLGELVKDIPLIGAELENLFKETLQIHSPSRMTKEMGILLDEGLALGILEGTDSFEKSTDKVGSIAKKGFEDAITQVSDLIDNGMDDKLTITPVLDLSEIQNGTNQLYSMVKDANGYELDATLSRAENARKSMRSNGNGSYDDSANSINGNTSTDNSVYNNTFNITGSNSKEIADEVSKVIQKQIERRHAKWAN